MAKIIGLTFPGEAPSEEPAAEKFVCPHCGKRSFFGTAKKGLDIARTIG